MGRIGSWNNPQQVAAVEVSEIAGSPHIAVVSAEEAVAGLDMSFLVSESLEKVTARLHYQVNEYLIHVGEDRM